MKYTEWNVEDDFDYNFDPKKVLKLDHLPNTQMTFNPQQFANESERMIVFNGVAYTPTELAEKALANI